MAEIRARTPRQLEVEVFVHGAMCVSYSGRCVLSNYMTGRDAQRGACAQPCRYKYALMEEKRPGEYFPVEEDGKGAYIFSSRDMCMIGHIPQLLQAGVDCLKIEGRAKSAYYAAVTANAYRHAIDAAAAGEPLDDVWREEVEKVSHRHYSTGFYFGPPGQYTADARYIRTWQVAAVVESCAPSGGRGALPAQQVLRRGRSGADRTGDTAHDLHRPGDDRRGRPAPVSAPHAPDGLPYEAAPPGAPSVHPAHLPGESSGR